jgi:hypothetical protein
METSSSDVMQELLENYKKAKRKRRKTLLFVFGGIFLFSIIIAVVSSNTKDKSSGTQLPQENKEPQSEWPQAQIITAADLVSKYEDNEVSADDEYKGKNFYVTGILSHIGKDILDDIYITLKAGNGFRSVQCYISNAQLAAQLRKGDRVKIYGKCDGLMMNVLMKDCKLVERSKHDDE